MLGLKKNTDDLFWALNYHFVGLDSVCATKQILHDAMVNAGYPAAGVNLNKGSGNICRFI